VSLRRKRMGWGPSVSYHVEKGSNTNVQAGKSYFPANLKGTALVGAAAGGGKSEKVKASEKGTSAKKKRCVCFIRDMHTPGKIGGETGK